MLVGARKGEHAPVDRNAAAAIEGPPSSSARRRAAPPLHSSHGRDAPRAAAYNLSLLKK
jgi:hypothetical protein